MKIISEIAKHHKCKVQIVDFEYKKVVKTGYVIYSTKNITGNLTEYKIDSKKAFEVITIQPCFTYVGVRWFVFNHLNNQSYSDIKTEQLKQYTGVTMPNLYSIKSKLKTHKIDSKKYSISVERKDNSVTVISYCDSLHFDFVKYIFPNYKVKDISLPNKTSKYFKIECI